MILSQIGILIVVLGEASLLLTTIPYFLDPCIYGVADTSEDSKSINVIRYHLKSAIVMGTSYRSRDWTT